MRYTGLLLTGLAALAMFAGLLSIRSTAALPGAIDLVAIDMDITGNDDSTVGTIEQCYEMSTVGETHTFDLVVKGVDPVDKIAGYQIDIDYDPSVIRIGIDDDGDTLFDEDPVDPYSIDDDGDTQIDEDPWDFIDVDAAGSTPPDDVTILSRIDSRGGAGFISISDTQWNPNSATFVAADLTISPPPPDNHESGEGVLARITVTAVGTGTSGLIVPGPSGGQDGFVDLMLMAGDGPLKHLPVPVNAVQIGAVSVGEPCVVPTPPPPTPTPTPTPTPAPTPTATPAPTPTPTPTPTTPTSTPTPTPPLSTVDLVAIDMDTTGNDDSTVGTIENCGEIAAVGDTHTFDLVIKGVDPADRIKGYQIDIDYDPAVIQIGIDDDGDTLIDEDPVDFIDNDLDTMIDEDSWDFIDVDAAGSTPPDDVTILSRIDSRGGAGFLSNSDTQWNPNSATFVAADGTISPPPPDNHESGDGVLARITVTAVGTGTSPLLIPSTLGGQDGYVDLMLVAGTASGYAELAANTVLSGEVVVGGPCGDSDGDGFTDTDEGVIGTDPADPCADTANPGDEGDDKWPADFDDNQIINLADLFSVLPPYFGSSPSNPDTNGDGIADWSPRADLSPDGLINLGDVFPVLPPVFGAGCE